MAYKEKVFNANVLTDLLSTYLTHRSGEREKYYQAEVVANKPQYKVVDGNLLQIDPMTGGIETLYSKPKEIKEPKFEDFPQMDKDGKPTGMTIKGVHTGTDKKIAGVPQVSKHLFLPQKIKNSLIFIRASYLIEVLIYMVKKKS